MCACVRVVWGPGSLWCICGMMNMAKSIQLLSLHSRKGAWNGVYVCLGAWYVVSGVLVVSLITCTHCDMQQYELHGTETSSPRPNIWSGYFRRQVKRAGWEILGADRPIYRRNKAEQGKHHPCFLSLSRSFIIHNYVLQETNLALREEINSYQGTFQTSLSPCTAHEIMHTLFFWGGGGILLLFSVT